MDHRKIVARLAWSFCVLCVSLALGALLLWLLNGKALVGFTREGDGAIVVLVISFSVVGALIVSHRLEDAARTLTAFSARLLRDETDYDALSGELVAVVQVTVQPARVSQRLRPPEEQSER